jgi:predicted deacylase
MSFSVTVDQTNEADHRKARRFVDQVTRPLDELAKTAKNFYAAPLGRFEVEHQSYRLPRYLFIGPKGGDEYLRLGIFAGVHGDEMAGSLAILPLVQRLLREPETARGYELFLYPLVNPTGFEDGTRWSRRGKDLNREFWQGSKEPEVVLLEEQLRGLEFHGTVSLHADDTSEGVYGFARGAELTRHVLEPALARAEKFISRNFGPSIDNFKASNGIIVECYEGVLSAPPEAQPRPFEIVFETPQLAPLDRQIEASVEALVSILNEYRILISVGQNI